MSNVTDELVRNACFSADEVAMEFYDSGADRTRAVVRRALEALEANELITVKPLEEWPDTYAPYPPYKRLHP